MLPVTKIQQFCTKDGPGIRTTVFLKGCPLRCVWCHNPETQTNAQPFFYSDNLCVRCGECVQYCPWQVHRIDGEQHYLDRSKCDGCMACVDACPTGALERGFEWCSAEDIYQHVMKDAAFYGASGGVTISGGEPTVHAGKLISLLKRFRENDIHTAIETCGYFDPALLPELTASTSLFLWDVKDTDDRRHLANTGVSNRKILDNLRKADALGAATILRCIVLRSINLDDTHLQTIFSLYASLKHCRGVELIPYHTYGVSKYAQLGQPVDPHKEWIPSAEEMTQAEAFLRQYIPTCPTDR